MSATMAATSASTSPERRRPLKVGLMLPSFEPVVDGPLPRWADLLAYARSVEEAGFDSLWAGDHLLFQSADKVEGGWEAWSLLAALAATTTRIELGVMVACMGFRNPALLAKMADTVDEISGGRLTLGLGAGWGEFEFRAFGYPYDHRVSRFEEGLTIIHSLLKQGKVDFVGKYHQARECELLPRRPRPGGPPILIGSTSGRMLELTARYADQWNGFFAHWASPVPDVLATVDAACVKVGRDPATLTRTMLVRADVPGSTGYPLGQGRYLSGSLEEMAETMRGYANAGITHLQVWLYPLSFSEIEKFARILEILDRG
jgi:probable F420-dependent oxidoreductase